MNNNTLLNDDRLFPVEPSIRALAKSLYDSVKDLPIISPHGHTDPAWFADNNPFSNPSSLLIQPDHYLLRMFYSQGIDLREFGINRQDADPRQVWRLFCKYYYLFRATPSRIWLDHAIYSVFGVDKAINETNADVIFDHINEQLQQPAFRPRALFERFNIELLATTESPLDDLHHHQQIQQSDWQGRVITTFRPDPVIDPDYEGFLENIEQLGALTDCDTSHYEGYLEALRLRRHYFKQYGATATDHGHPTARTMNLSAKEASHLFQKILNGDSDENYAELFRANMLVEMAKMSIEDGLVMQLHPGSFRNHNIELFINYGRDKGADIPLATNYVEHLKPLLDLVGNETSFNLILFTLDETTYSRELAPLAGHYPCLKLGPAWWFHDSVEGMRRYRRMVTETAGFYNTAGFNDDTRAFVSIPARHDMARRIDCGFLAELVLEHRINEEEAYILAQELSGELAKRSYRL